MQNSRGGKMTGQIRPGLYRTAAGVRARVSRLRLAPGTPPEWVYDGALESAPGVWTLTSWTLSGRAEIEVFDLVERIDPEEETCEQ